MKDQRGVCRQGTRRGKGGGSRVLSAQSHSVARRSLRPGVSKGFVFRVRSAAGKGYGRAFPYRLVFARAGRGRVVVPGGYGYRNGIGGHLPQRVGYFQLKNQHGVIYQLGGRRKAGAGPVGVSQRYGRRARRLPPGIGQRSPFRVGTAAGQGNVIALVHRPVGAGLGGGRVILPRYRDVVSPGGAPVLRRDRHGNGRAGRRGRHLVPLG